MIWVLSSLIVSSPVLAFSCFGSGGKEVNGRHSRHLTTVKKDVRVVICLCVIPIHEFSATDFPMYLRPVQAKGTVALPVRWERPMALLLPVDKRQ